MSPEADHPRSSEEPPQGGGVPLDLEPLHELSQAEHSRIINRLSDLLLSTVRSLRSLGVSELAGRVAGSASDILADYDPDVADVVRRAAGSSDRGEILRRSVTPLSLQFTE